MRKREPGGVQELPLQAEIASDAVNRVARHRKVDGRQVDADLVRPAGFERHTQERMPREKLDGLKVRHRVARRVRVQRDSGRITPVSPDRRLDPPPSRARPAAHERGVLADELTPAQRALQAPVRLVRARDDEEARGVAVEPMDDPGPFRFLAAGDGVTEEPVYECPARMAR
jgi:hypothetical protein